MAHTRRRIFLAVGLWTMLSGVAQAQQMTGAPFVEQVTMTVIDPTVWLAEVKWIAGFTHLAELPDGQVMATFHGGSHRLGVMRLDGKTLELREVFWLDESTAKQKCQWLAATTSGEGAFTAVCAPAVHAGDDVECHVVTYNPKRTTPWLVTTLNAPQAPTAIAMLDGGQMAMLTAPSNWLLRWPAGDGPPVMHKVIFDFVPFEYPPGRALFRSREGFLYGSYKARLFCFHPDRSAFEYLGHLPCQFGHLSETALTAMASDGENLLVGGGSADGYLFAFDLANRQVRSLGRPTDGTEIRALAFAGPSGFWGIAATPGQSCRLFHYESRTGALTDLGVPMGTLEANGRMCNWHAFDIADLAALSDGRVLLAEGSNQAKLLAFDANRTRK